MRRFLILASTFAYCALGCVAPASAAGPKRLAQQSSASPLASAAPDAGASASGTAAAPSSPASMPAAPATAGGATLPGGLPPLSAQRSNPASVAVPNPIPTPAPGGTPVTFGGQAEGKPIPNTTPSPIATSFPTTKPGGKYHSYDQRREIFVTGDYLIQPRVYNEFSSGTRTGKASYSLQGAVEFNIHNLPLLVGGEYRDIQYQHNAGFVTTIGRGSKAFQPAFVLRDTEYDGRLGIKLLEPRVYVVASYLEKTREVGYPIVQGYGFGLQKLPDYEAPLSIYFELLYYPNLTAAFTPATLPGSLGLRYKDLRYRIGAAIAPPDSPIFIDAGLLGDRLYSRNSAPSDEVHISPYAGIGIYTHK